jgi:hypothetical protein
MTRKSILFDGGGVYPFPGKMPHGSAGIVGEPGPVRTMPGDKPPTITTPVAATGFDLSSLLEGELIPGVPNWILAAAVAAFFFLKK